MSVVVLQDDGDWALDAPDARLEAMMDRQYERIPGTLRWKNKTPIRGAGDVVERVTSFFGIAKCPPCEERRKWLNEKFPLNRTKE